MLNKSTCALSATALLTAIVGILFAHLEIISPTAGLALYAIAALLGLAATFASMAVLFITQSYPVAMFGVIGALPLIAMMANGFEAARFPTINDISTDLENIPTFTTAQTLPKNTNRNMQFPTAFTNIIQQKYPELQPLLIDATPDELYAQALRHAETQQPNWTITHRDPKTRTIEGVAVTKVFRWRDDFIIRVSEINANNQTSARLDMRSKSRDGKGDLGENARRIRKFLDAIQTARQ